MAIVLVLIGHAPSAWSEQRPLHIVGPDVSVSGRLLAFDLHIRSGWMASLPRCPIGWNITIENDPSWNTHVEGHAVVGAAAIEVHDIARILTIARVPRADVFPGMDPIDVSGTITLMQGGDIRDLSFHHLELR